MENAQIEAAKWMSETDCLFSEISNKMARLYKVEKKLMNRAPIIKYINFLL